MNILIIPSSCDIGDNNCGPVSGSTLSASFSSSLPSSSLPSSSFSSSSSEPNGFSHDVLPCGRIYGTWWTQLDISNNWSFVRASNSVLTIIGCGPLIQNYKIKKKENLN